MDLKAMNAALAGLCAKYAVVTPGELVPASVGSFGAAELNLNGS